MHLVGQGPLEQRQQALPLPLPSDILGLDEDPKGEDGPRREAHLYLTDYRALYAAHIVPAV